MAQYRHMGPENPNAVRPLGRPTDCRSEGFQYDWALLVAGRLPDTLNEVAVACSCSFLAVAAS